MHRIFIHLIKSEWSFVWTNVKHLGYGLRDYFLNFRTIWRGHRNIFVIIFDTTILSILNTLTTSNVKPFIRLHLRVVRLFTRIDHMPIEKSSSSWNRKKKPLKMNCNICLSNDGRACKFREKEKRERESSQSYKGYWQYTHLGYSSPTTMSMFIT